MMNVKSDTIEVSFAADDMFVFSMWEMFRNGTPALVYHFIIKNISEDASFVCRTDCARTGCSRSPAVG